MGKHEALICSLAEPVLTDGETVVATVLVNYNGTVPPASLASPPRLDGNSESAPHPDALVAFPTARQMALALTPRRLLVWSLGFTGKPKQYIGEVPLSSIVGVSADAVRFGGLVHLTMRSGAKVDIEIPDSEPGPEFVTRLIELSAA